jgi:PAS domain S-box-containing protein
LKETFADVARMNPKTDSSTRSTPAPDPPALAPGKEGGSAPESGVEGTEKQSEAGGGGAVVTAEVQLETMLNKFPDRIYFKDRQSRFIKISQSVAKRLGMTNSAEVIGKTDFDFQTPAKAREYYEDDQRIIQTGEPLVNKIEEQLQPNGETEWVSVTKVPMRDSEGNIVGLVGINRNINQLKRTEELLRLAAGKLEEEVAKRTAELSHERRVLRTLIDHLPDGIYAKDAAARKTLANPADLRHFRCQTEAEAIGKTDFDQFPPETAAKFLADDQAVLAGRPVHNREEYYFDENGRKHWLLTSKLPLSDDQGTIIGLVGIGRDITAQKEAEQKLEVAQRELLEASRKAGMAEVATGVLHNVGNVLNSVSVSSQVIGEQLRKSMVAGVAKVGDLLLEHDADLGRFLTEDKRGPQVPVYLKELGQHLERERSEILKELDNLVKNIEHIKEIVAMQQSYATVSGVRETVELQTLMEEALRIHGSSYERHGVVLVREYEPLPAMSVDRHRILQILVNLLSNAKYACEMVAEHDKLVTVRLRAGSNGRVRFEVSDNGMGIAPENLTRVFSQGFSTRKGGHGFGLHNGALAAKEMKGSLTAQSDGPGRGATFVLELPLPVGEKSR